jgi:hypothetical protein
MYYLNGPYLNNNRGPDKEQNKLISRKQKSAVTESTHV